MKTKHFWFALVFLMILFLCCFAYADVVDSGDCGKTVTWTLDSSGTLTISGKGEMEFEAPSPPKPMGSKLWTKGAVKSVIIEKGVTTICTQAFYTCTELTKITIPDTIKKIQWGAFANTSLHSITIPSSVSLLGGCLFDGCTSLTKIEFIVTDKDQKIVIAENLMENCSAKIYCYNETVPHLFCVLYNIPFELYDTDIDVVGERLIDRNYKLLPESVVMEDGRLRYKPTDGSITEGIIVFNGLSYYIDADGYFCDGWKTVDGTLYCFNGLYNTALIGIESIGDGVLCGFGPDGAMVKNVWLYYEKEENWEECTISTEPIKKDGAFYLDENGHPVVGWQTIGGKIYYFYGDGRLLRGTRIIGVEGVPYVIGSDCALVTEPGWFHYTDGDKYSGIPVEGWVYVGDTNGVLHLGWFEDNGNRYLLTPVMLTDRVCSYEMNYSSGFGSFVIPESGYFDLSGIWHTFTGFPAWQLVNNTWYYLKDDGTQAVGWNKIDGKWYYFEYSGMVTGWLKDGKNWYYLRSDGTMATGWIQNGEDWYYLQTDGIMATVWLHIGEDWYYLKPNGAMVRGWIQEGSSWYYMTSAGKMATGWVLDGNTWYYLQSDGTMATGWLKIGKNWYYFADGAMKTGWLENENHWYWFDENGSMVTGWLESGGHWYWFDENGSMVTGWKEISGSWEMFDENSGEWLYTWTGD